MAVNHRLRIVVAGALLWEVLTVAPAVGQDFDIVYSRCQRTPHTVEVQDGTQALRYADVQDALPEVDRFQGSFNAPCDLVHRASNGQERVLYDCSSSSNMGDACAALDPAVSFDGRTVAFAVFRGALYTEWITPNKYLAGAEAQLHLVDIASGKVTALPHTSGVFDSGPAWLADGRLAFTTTRGNVFRTLVNDRSPRVSQIYSMDPDGRNVEQASHHALGGEQHPLTLSDGRLAYSSWQLFGALAYRKSNGSPGNAGSVANLFHLFTQYPDGAQAFALFGQHIDAFDTVNSRMTHKASHFIGEGSDGRVWTTDYYRRNNLGLGNVFGLMPPPEGQEGIHPDESTFGNFFRPRDMLRLANWASSSDNFSDLLEGPALVVAHYSDPMVYAGKLGHPAGIPGDQLMVSWAKGACSTVSPQGSGIGVAMRYLTQAGDDNPGCDVGIYVTTQIPSDSPHDLQLVVDSPHWHEIMAKPVVPYSDIYGVAEPNLIERAADRAVDHPHYQHVGPGSPFGLLGAASIVDRETAPKGGITFEGEAMWGLQGTDTINYSDGELCGIRILGVQPNHRIDESQELNAPAGERVVILGEFPVRNYDNGTPVIDSMGNHDTSFLVRFPANTPYLMQAIDCEGRTLNSDQTWQHLRPGEIKTCNGCHVHSREGMPFESTYAAGATHQPFRLGEGQVPLLSGGNGGAVNVTSVAGYGVAYEFERDIMPIFQQRCSDSGCHGNGSSSGGLALDIPGTDSGSTWFQLVRDNQGLRRPQLSPYVRFMSSRASLLYWKAAGQPTDNGTLSNGPVPFGPAHATALTPAELGTIARWIDTGAGAGQSFLKDTTPPVLTVSATESNGAIDMLQVGTVDVPTGINAASLSICVVQADGGCGPNLAGNAAPHGTISINTAPLSDPDAVIRFRVEDLAGNVTQFEKTVRRLLDQPLPQVLPPRRPPLTITVN